MTDATLMDVVPTRRIDFDSEAAQNRVKGRCRAEARFRAYGIAALVVTTLFLVALLGFMWETVLATQLLNFQVLEMDREFRG